MVEWIFSACLVRGLNPTKKSPILSINPEKSVNQLLIKDIMSKSSDNRYIDNISQNFKP